MITDRKQAWHAKMADCGVQEVIFGQTPCIVPEVEGWPGQKPTDRITRIEEFKR